MNTINKTGVAPKTAGDGLSHRDINAMNSTTNAAIDAVNYLLQNFCNINAERGNSTETYTLSQAITIVPQLRRASGMKIRFLTEAGYVEYVYSKNTITTGDWENPINWRVALTMVDGGEW